MKLYEFNPPQIIQRRFAPLARPAWSNEIQFAKGNGNISQFGKFFQFVKNLQGKNDENGFNFIKE